MRQAGIIAAAGLYALEHLTDRLKEDHRLAQRIARGLHQVDSSIVDPVYVETNIVRASLGASGRSAAQWSADLKEHGVRANAYNDTDLRLVTHRHIGDVEIDRLLDIFSLLWKKSRAPI